MIKIEKDTQRSVFYNAEIDRYMICLRIEDCYGKPKTLTLSVDREVMHSFLRMFIDGQVTLH